MNFYQIYSNKAAGFLFSLALLIQSYAACDCTTDLAQEYSDTTVEWVSPPTGFGSKEPFTPLVNYNGASYLVWVDTNYRPWITKVVNGTAVSSPLDPNADYKAQPDGHHRYSLGIDTDGYLHVTGDMHYYSLSTIGVINPYPQRYQKQKILYWKSNKPEDISAFTFAGGVNATTAIPGSGWTYGGFFYDNCGTLYFSAIVEAIASGNFFPGKIGLGLYRYDTTTKKWTALGGLPEQVAPGSRNTVLFWETGGQKQGGPGNVGWFQGFQPFFGFDVNNRMHFAISVNTDPNFVGNNRVIYAVSEDGGNTWKKANGASIPTLPIRALDGKPSQGDVVATSTTTTFSDQISTIGDKEGVPAVFVSDKCYTWNGTAWATVNTQNFPKVMLGRYAYIDPVGNLVVTRDGPSKILHAATFNSSVYGIDLGNYTVGYDGFTGVSRYGLFTTGNVYGLAVQKKTNVLTILKTRMLEAPLPCGWKSQDVAPVLPSYRSTAGYANDTFNLNNYGSNIGNTADDFQYVYKQSSGDATIIARVSASNGSTEGYTRAGLMIRQDLSPTSPYVATLLAPGTSNKGTVFSYRANQAAYASDANIAGNVNGYWVKLVRKGNVFTGFTSADGAAWKQVGQVTLNLPQSLYIGLAASANASGYFSQRATFEQVTAPWGNGLIIK
jgi:regulation of enolase protein 1 (concanavalin A-like superfamily)